MKKRDPSNDNDDEFAFRLEQIDDSLASETPSATGSRSTEAHQDSVASTDLNSDPDLAGAAKVLKMIYRVREFQQHSSPPLTHSVSDEAVSHDLVTKAGSTIADSSRQSLALEAFQPIPDRIGRFVVERMIGQGGFGLVFLAEDTALHRHVAIKLPRPDVLINDATTDRFLREGQASAALSHPSIVPVYEVGHFANIGYIASAYCAGGTLSQWLQRHPEPLDPHAAAALVAQLADAVQHAHLRSVYHRDLKPSNILLDSADLAGTANGQGLAQHAKISDFGLAKLVGDQLTASHTEGSIGTPSYMPPEQADGGMDALTPAADVYSLGAILYELLCRRPPFLEPTALATLDAVRHQAPLPPRRITPSTPDDLEAIILRCLEKSPQHRYHSAQDLADDLLRFLSGQSVHARKTNALERSRRWCQRNPVVTILVTAVIILAIGSTIAAVQLAASKQRVVEALQATVDANHQAATSEYNAQVAYSTVLQQSRRPGQRMESLRAIERASQLARQLETLPEVRRDLRNATISGLGFWDLTPNQRWPIQIVGERFLATDPECKTYARVDDTNQTIVLHRISDNRILKTLSLADNHQRLIGLRFSENGRWLGARYQIENLEERLRIWEIDSSKLIGDQSIGGIGQAADFGKHDESIAWIRRDGQAIQHFRLPSLAQVSETRLESRAQVLALHPKRSSAAVDASGSVDIIDLAKHERTHRFACPNQVSSIAFSPSGQHLVVGCRDGEIFLYEVNGQPKDDIDELIIPSQTFKSHNSIIANLAWHPNGKLFCSSSINGESRLWNFIKPTPILEFTHKGTNFSRDGQWLGIEGGRMRVVQSNSHRVFSQNDAKVHAPFDLGLYPRTHRTSEIDYWVTLPGTSLVIGQNYFRIVVRDLKTDQALIDRDVPACWFRFDQDGNWLYASSQTAGFCRLPIHRTETDSAITLQIGPAENIHSARGGAFALAENKIALTPYLSPGLLFHPDTPSETRRLNVHPLTFWCDLSPNGKYFATGVIRAQGVRIFDTETGELVKTLDSLTAAPWFFPNGQRLIVAENSRFTIYETENWTPVHEINSVAGGIWPGSLAFSPDGTLLAVEFGPSIQLLDSSVLKKIATFHAPIDQRIESIGFSGDGRFLIAGGGDQDQTHVWDLTRIRRVLRQRGLDWNVNAPPTSETNSADKPLQVKLLLDGLLHPPGPQHWSPSD